jgi:hypothetical protein
MKSNLLMNEEFKWMPWENEGNRGILERWSSAKWSGEQWAICRMMREARWEWGWRLETEVCRWAREKRVVVKQD